MAEKEGLVPYGIAARPPAASHLQSLRFFRRTSSHPPLASRVFAILLRKMAEKEGFEPPVEFPPQLISSQSHSATLPLLHTKDREENGTRLKDQLNSGVAGSDSAI